MNKKLKYLLFGIAVFVLPILFALLYRTLYFIVNDGPAAGMMTFFGCVALIFYMVFLIVETDIFK